VTLPSKNQNKEQVMTPAPYYDIVMAALKLGQRHMTDIWMSERTQEAEQEHGSK